MRALVILELLAAVLLLAPRAGARSAGITGLGVNGCNQCHSGGTAPMVTLTADSPCLLAGASTVIHFAITNTNGGAGGWNVRISAGGGALSVGGPESAQTRAAAGEITHTAPKVPAADNLIHFSAVYTAPAAAGAATLLVWGNSVNLSGNTSGDRAASATLALTVAAPASCGAATCGTVSDACGVTTMDCGTCAAPLTCSGGACLCAPTAPIPECGTGQCLRSGSSCLPSSCTPGAPTPEVCNHLDDDCDGFVDNGLALATCGTGACLRTGTTCDPASCTPGIPAAEICNGLDDNCDGSVDEGDLCPSGGICLAGVCLFPVDAGADAGPDETVDPDSAAAADAADGTAQSGATEDSGAPLADATSNASGDATIGTEDGFTPVEDDAPPDVVAKETTDPSMVIDADAGSAIGPDADEPSTGEAGDSVAIPTDTGASLLDDTADAQSSAASGCSMRAARSGHAPSGVSLLTLVATLAALRRARRRSTASPSPARGARR